MILTESELELMSIIVSSTNPIADIHNLLISDIANILDKGFKNVGQIVGNLVRKDLLHRAFDKNEHRTVMLSSTMVLLVEASISRRYRPTTKLVLRK